VNMVRMPRAIAAAIALALAASAARGGELFDEETIRFASRVDARALSLLAVQHNGRLTILDTLSREALLSAYGREEIDGLAPAFAWLELHWNAGKYLDKPVLQVRERALRAGLLKRMPPDAAEEFRKTWRLAPAALMDETAIESLLDAGQADMADLNRAGKVPSLRAELTDLYARPECRGPIDRLGQRYSALFSAGALRVIPSGERWLAADAAPPTREEAADMPRARHGMQSLVPRLIDGLRARDANAVDSVIETWTAEQRASAPTLAFRELELQYNRMGKGGAAWAGFALSAALLIAAAASGRRWLKNAGLAAMALSAMAGAAAFAVRWILSGRAWYLPPLVNMFEVVTASAFLAAMVALAMEPANRRAARLRERRAGEDADGDASRGDSPIAIAASLYASAACGFCYFLRGSVGGAIAPTHGLLESPLMAAHVTVIILGHVLAGMSMILSLIYLAAAGLGAAGIGRGRKTSLSPPSGMAGAGWRASPSAAAMDRRNVALAQLACWTLALGTALGAMWADAAWGRWWGWDRKETWTLITILFFVAALHARAALPEKRRGAVTAGLCVLGGAAMLFNWIAVNFLLPGLHSYA
jgi:ABC-type transport system involved in cytochrome c biogenesis permease subunit